MKLLEEILSDYPRIWNYYKHDTGEKSRGPKYAQRYPVPIGTLSLIIDFHKWTHRTAYLVSSETGIQLTDIVKRTEVGPSPVVMYRLQWLNNNWGKLETQRKSLAKTLSDEVLHWHTRIRVKVNDGDIYTYESTVVCEHCSHRSVMRMNDRFICVNISCKNLLTGEWRTWQA